MWGTLAIIGIDVGLYVWNRYIDTPSKPPYPAPKGFSFPEMQEGIPIPIVYGTTVVDQPILAWWGNASAQVGESFGVPWIYGSDMVYVLGVPVQSALPSTYLRRVWWGDVLVQELDGTKLRGEAGLQTFTANIDGVGSTGQYEFKAGSTTQTIGPLLSSIIAVGGFDATLWPPFRNQMLLVISMGLPDKWPAYDKRIGASSTVPALKVELVSPTTLSIIAADDCTDANPAWMIYDLLTGTIWKAGIPTSDIDTSSFTACAATLWNEGHGFAGTFNTSQDFTSIIQQIVDQIGGVLYQDTTSGLIKLRLIRAGDTPFATSITADNTIGEPKVTRTTWRQTYNQVRVTFPNRINNYKQSAAIVQDLGVMAMQDGRIRTLEINYPGCPTADLASKLAARELGAASRPLTTATCEVNRSFYNLAPGDVVTVSWPKYGISSMNMRVMAIDPGQLASGNIKLSLAEDVFDRGGQYGVATPPTSQPPDPLTKQLVMECPRWQRLQLVSAALAADADAPCILACATPDDAATSYACNTFTPGTGVRAALAIGQSYTRDVPPHAFPATFTIVNNYPRIDEPYDTTSNQLVIANLTNWNSTLIDFATVTSLDGTLQLALVTPAGLVEIVSFESVTNLGGGQYQLNNVWRGLLDTVPLDHTAGERGWLIFDDEVGRLSYNVGAAVKAQLVPTLDGRSGSGEDTIDSLTIVARALRPYPAADQGVGGDAVVGTFGIPTNANRYKVLTFAEEGLDFYGTKRDRYSTTVIRGDFADDTLIDSTIYIPMAVIAGATITPGGSFPNDLTVISDAGVYVSGGILGGGCWNVDGYGSIDLNLQSFGPLPTSGKYGIAASGSNFNRYTLNNPRTNAFLPSWRNLLANVRWNYQRSSDVAAWDNFLPNTGTPVIGSGSFSLSRLTSGNGSYYLGTSSTAFTRGQRVPLGFAANPLRGDGRWTPRGLTLIAAGYFRNANSDTNDTVTLWAKAYQFNPTTPVLSNSSTFVPANANWTYREVSLAPGGAGGLPSNTAMVGAQFDFAEVAAGGGTGAADCCATELRLFAGQFASDITSLLANPSFDAGTTASWTVDSGGFVVASTIASPSIDYVQGGAFASSQLHQDYTLPTGFEYGTAILRCYRAQTLANDAGTVTVQVLNGSNAVIASTTTGSEQMPTLNAWYGRTLYVDTPDGAAKIRVVFAATRSLGSGNSGACFDEANLMFAKHLDASSKMSLTFDTPTVQQMPQTWQEYHQDYPANVIPDIVYGGVVPGFDASVEWSDGNTRGAALMTGQFGNGLTETEAYPLTRTSSGSQIFVQPVGAAATAPGGTIGVFSLTQSFTALCYFRVDEPAFSSLCGLIGRMNASRGWGINITAAGQLQALLRGNSGTTKSVSSGRVVSEGALHMAALVYDASAHLLYIYDEQGLGASVSTASGLNDFASLSTDTDCYFRMGTDSTDHDTLPGQIGPVYLWSTALSAGAIATHWNYAKDPTGQITTYTRTAAAIVPISNDSLGNAVACVMSAAQVALAYDAVLAGDGGTGLGLAVGKSATNLLPDVNFAGANWVADSTVVLTQGQADPTGRPRGVQVAGDSSHGFYAQNITVAASPGTIPVVFWAMSVSGSTSLSVQLRTSAGALIGSTPVTLTNVWQKFAVKVSGWAGATATCQIRFLPGGTATFQLAGIMCVMQGTDFPAILPLPNATHGNYNATITTSLAKQFVYEGEIIAQGCGMIDSPTPAAGTLVQCTAGSNTNLRELQVISGSSGFRCVHYDAAGTPAHVDATSGYSTYSSRVFKARARWALCGMLDNVTLPVMSAVAWTDDTHSTITEAIGRAAAWTISATNLTSIKIGAGTASPSDVVLRNVTVRAREEKLP